MKEIIDRQLKTVKYGRLVDVLLKSRLIQLFSSGLADWLKNLASITSPLISWGVSETANALIKKLVSLISELAVCAHLWPIDNFWYQKRNQDFAKVLVGAWNKLKIEKICDVIFSFDDVFSVM